MLMLTFYHGLRVSELCHLKRQDVDIKHSRIWIARLKGSLSTEQPLRTDELQALKRYLPERGDAQVPWCFLIERGDQFTRFAINYPVGVTWKRVGLPFHVHPNMLRHGCGYALANRGYDLRLIQDYRDTLHFLESLRPDIWLAHHTESFDFGGKRQRAATEGVIAWVDTEGYWRWIASKRRAFEDKVDVEMGVQKPQ
jgi:hypothetical protein